MGGQKVMRHCIIVQNVDISGSPCTEDDPVGSSMITRIQINSLELLIIRIDT